MMENGAYLTFYCRRDHHGFFPVPMDALVGQLGRCVMPGEQRAELLRETRCPVCRRCDRVDLQIALHATDETGKIGFDGHRREQDSTPAAEARPDTPVRPWPKRRRRSRHRSGV